MSGADVEGARRHIGERVGDWTIVDVADRGRNQPAFVVECGVCHKRRERTYREFVRGARCVACPWAKDPMRLSRARALANMPAIDPDLPFDLDPVCRKLVAERGPFTLEETGAALGMTRERARQIEANALKKLRRLGLPIGAALRDYLEHALQRRDRGHPLADAELASHEGWSGMRGTLWTSPPVHTEHEGPGSAEVRRLDAILSDVEAKAERVTSKVRKLP